MKLIFVHDSRGSPSGPYSQMRTRIFAWVGFLRGGYQIGDKFVIIYGTHMPLVVWGDGLYVQIIEFEVFAKI